jgi:arylsulfatase A-like enzyme
MGARRAGGVVFDHRRTLTMNAPSKPSFLIFITDQQRAVRDFPQSWVDANLTNLNTLTANGLTFVNAITNASRCSPSRGVITTSLYAPANGLVSVGATLPTNWTTLAKALSTALPDYTIGYIGKWHMTQSFVQPSTVLPNPPTLLAAENAVLADDYGTPGWDAPDAGTALGWQALALPTQPPTVADPYVSTSNTLGGGPKSYNPNDARFVDDAVKFLGALGADDAFVLVVSLVNPHDVWSNMYAQLMQQQYPEFPAAFDALTGAGDFALPESYSADNLSTKPTIQTTIRNNYTTTWAQNNGVNPVPTMLDADDALTYLKFYAYLTYLADQQLQQVYKALSALPQFADTIVVRIADHGEMGMSHAGSMEKDCNVYAEVINIPYIFSNAGMFAQATTCEAQIGHVDLLPTLLGLVGQSPPAGTYQGTDCSAFVLDPTATPQPACSIFTYDDGYPVHIRAVQAAAGAVTVNGQPTATQYKYAVYYQLNGSTVNTSTLQFELYVPGADGEITNLAPSNPALCSALHTLLTQRMAQIDATRPSGAGLVTPDGWPSSP